MADARFGFIAKLSSMNTDDIRKHVLNLVSVYNIDL